MPMLLGPVFQLELVTTGRRPRYLMLRVVFACVMLFVLWLCCIDVARVGRVMTIAEAAQIAESFFLTFCWLMLTAVLLVAPAMCVGTISLERERRTIEYLFTTDLSNHEIVLSKLAVRLLLMAKLLLVGLPILIIFRLLGGIRTDQIAAAYLISGSTAVAVSCMAVCVSVWTPRSRDAVLRVYLLLAAVLFLPMLIMMVSMTGMMGGAWPWVRWLADNLVFPIDRVLILVNPLWTMIQAQGLMTGSTTGNLDMSPIWQMVAAHAVSSAVFLLLAVAAVRRVHLRAAGSSDDGSRKGRWRLRLPSWRPPMGEFPMLWKEMFARTAATRLGVIGRIALGVLVLGFGALMAGFYIMAVYSGTPGVGTSPWEFYLMMSSVYGSMFVTGVLMLMALRASTLITLEKDRDCWLSLLSTPMTGGQIIIAKAIGNLYAFRWLLVMAILFWGATVTLMPFYVIALPFQVGALVVAALWVSIVGVSFSLISKNTLRAMGATIGTVFFLGGGYMLCCCVPLAITSNSGDPAIFEIGTAGCIPVLLFAPAWIFALLADSSMMGQEDWIVPAYLLGMVYYVVFTAILFGAAIGRFEVLAGRTHIPEHGLGHAPSGGGA